jgi:hypothetical protein
VVTVILGAGLAATMLVGKESEPRIFWPPTRPPDRIERPVKILTIPRQNELIELAPAIYSGTTSSGPERERPETEGE